MGLSGKGFGILRDGEGFPRCGVKLTIGIGLSQRAAAPIRMPIKIITSISSASVKPETRTPDFDGVLAPETGKSTTAAGTPGRCCCVSGGRNAIDCASRLAHIRQYPLTFTFEIATLYVSHR